MAFHNVGSFFLAAGAVGRYWVSFGGADHGAQFIGGQVQNPGGCLQMSDQTKRMNADGSITYWVTIQNIGSVGTNFALQGAARVSLATRGRRRWPGGLTRAAGNVPASPKDASYYRINCYG
jgi:hypothetical protein